MSTEHPRDWAQTGTVPPQCTDESAHGEHEWYEKNLFRRQCPGFVGRARVPVRLGPYAEAPFGCPTCRTVVNAARAGGCADPWHSDNRTVGDPRVSRLQAALSSLAAEGDSEAVIITDPETAVRLDAWKRRPAGRWVTCQYRSEPHVLDDECTNATDVPWSPGEGMRRLKATMPGMVPELTDADFAKADEIIAAAQGPSINAELIHPEAHCHRCGGPNIAWSAPSPLWNQVMRGGSINGDELYDGIVCPVCFADLAEQPGIADLWKFSAKRVHVELETVTPSGRIWDESTWMWREPDQTGERVDALAELKSLRDRAYSRGVSEGRRLAAEVLRGAAAGRRTYAENAGITAVILEAEAGLLDLAADAAGGDLKPLYGWLPSWQWTDEMDAALDADRVTDGPGEASDVR